jgi:hypothetical protein
MDRVLPRRQSNRRTQERRNVPYEFNSPEWLATIKQQYILWPKQDRRVAERREFDRRNTDRRTGQRLFTNRGLRHQHFFSTASILDDEEKAMITALFADDDQSN